MGGAIGDAPPVPPDADEPGRVALAVKRALMTAPATIDLRGGGGARLRAALNALAPELYDRYLVRKTGGRSSR